MWGKCCFPFKKLSNESSIRLSVFSRLHNRVCGNQVLNPDKMFSLNSSLPPYPTNTFTGVGREDKQTIISET